MDSGISAYSAYSLMAANEQQSVPVWDSRADRYCGTLTTTDLLQLILLCSGMPARSPCWHACLSALEMRAGVARGPSGKGYALQVGCVHVL
jgi:hypothetical protein